ncbi:MAG: response regulator [Syntrophaceae bacterium]|nr:response regulator [Syntrophaceae bacterium]
MASILVVDDERIIREGCNRILAKLGYEVREAGSGEEGLNLLRAGPCDLLLLDLKMPGLSGMEVLQRVQQNHPSLLVVVITGYATVESAVEAMKAGAYDFIPKPFTPDQLRLVVHRALEKKALEMEAEGLRKEKERGLREIAGEKSKIRTIIHCMVDGVLVTDHEGQLVLHNPAAVRMLKMDGPPGFGLPIREALSREGLEAWVEKLYQVCEGKSPAVSQEIPIGGTTLMGHTAPVIGEEGEILGTVTVLRDIGLLKAMDRMKSDFVAMVSHELRAPLASVEQQLSVILAGILGEVNERQKEMMARAKERTHGLICLINDLLDLAKIEAGVVVQYRERLSIAEVLEKAVDILKGEAEVKNQTLHLSAPLSLPPVMADRRNMEEVFINLLSNAIKYTGEGGWVKVETRREGSYLCVQVEDNGIGIPPEDLPHIFDKFYRVKNAQTRRIVGTGLGLPIVKRIVEAHLGTVEVESRVGTGSKFRVYLPLDPFWKEGHEETVSAPDSGSPGGPS